MISGSFHVSAQEWRYYSREKALIHTLHLAELPSSLPGDTVLIAATPAFNNRNAGGGFSVPPLQLPQPPGFETTLFNTYNQYVSSNMYGCVAYDQTILARRNCTVVINSWTSALMRVTMTPRQGSVFLLHVEAQTDLRNLTYQGPAADGQCQCSITVDGTSRGNGNMQVFMQGASWNVNQYVQSVGHSSSTILAKVNSSIVFDATNVGDPAGSPIAAHMSCLAMAIDPSYIP